MEIWKLEMKKTSYFFKIFTGAECNETNLRSSRYLRRKIYRIIIRKPTVLSVYWSDTFPFQDHKPFHPPRPHPRDDTSYSGVHQRDGRPSSPQVRRFRRIRLRDGPPFKTSQHWNPSDGKLFPLQQSGQRDLRRERRYARVLHFNIPQRKARMER